MTCEDYLMGYRDLMDRVDELQAKIREIEIRLQSSSSRADQTKVKTSHGRRSQMEADLADLICQRDAVAKDAEEKRLELLCFIGKVGGQDMSGKRQRRLLKLYYAEGMSWNEVRQCLQPVQKQRRRGGDTHITGISEKTLFRVRLDALGAAELAYRRQRE